MTNNNDDDEATTTTELIDISDLEGHVVLIDLWSVQRTKRQIVAESTDDFRAVALFNVVRAITLQDANTRLLLLSRGAVPEMFDRLCAEAGYETVLHVDGCGLYTDHLYKCSAHRAQACLVFSSISGAGQNEDADMETVVATTALEQLIETYVAEQIEEREKEREAEQKRKKREQQQQQQQHKGGGGERSSSSCDNNSGGGGYSSSSSYMRMTSSETVTCASRSGQYTSSSSSSSLDKRGEAAIIIKRPRILTEVQAMHGMSLISPFYSEERLNRILDQDLSYIPSLFVGKAVPMSLVDSAIFQNTISPEIIPVVTALIYGLSGGRGGLSHLTPTRCYQQQHHQQQQQNSFKKTSSSSSSYHHQEQQQQQDRASLTCMSVPPSCLRYKDVENYCMDRGHIPLGLFRIIIEDINEELKGHRFMFLNPGGQITLRSDDIVYYLV